MINCSLGYDFSIFFFFPLFLPYYYFPSLLPSSLLRYPPPLLLANLPLFLLSYPLSSLLSLLHSFLLRYHLNSFFLANILFFLLSNPPPYLLPYLASFLPFDINNLVDSFLNSYFLSYLNCTHRYDSSHLPTSFLTLTARIDTILLTFLLLFLP